MKNLYIGLMSGTSADGIDAALVDFSLANPLIVTTHYTPYSQALKEKILALCQQGDDEIHRLGELDIILGKAFAQAVNRLLKNATISSQAVHAIGSHGQTIRHYPYHPHRFTLQIGDPNTIAAETGITTVADFRRKDIAHGGQGAPLVPAFHQHVLTADNIHRAVVNIGGIANITLLPQGGREPIVGFDMGPGNVLIDTWIHLHKQENYDQNGAWGAHGVVQPDLLKNLLSHAFFDLPPPKSTGREHFNLTWLNKHLHELGRKISPVDVQATLVELTVRSIIESIRQFIPNGEILVCGGGAHNLYLMTRLQELAKPHFTVDSTQKYGLDPDWVEAIAFAWLAQRTLNKQPGNLPSVTGAKEATILGGIYYGSI